MFGLFKKKNKIGESSYTAVFTTRNVMRENFPITRVYHGKDGSWQFFDNVSTNSNESLMIVGMGEVLKKDSSINKVLSIPEGFFASRENSRSEWIIEGFEEDEE